MAGYCGTFQTCFKIIENKMRGKKEKNKQTRCEEVGLRQDFVHLRLFQLMGPGRTLRFVTGVVN